MFGSIPHLINGRQGNQTPPATAKVKLLRVFEGGCLCGSERVGCLNLKPGKDVAGERVTVCVEHARTEAEALSVAFTVAESPLVKTALYAALKASQSDASDHSATDS